MNRKFHWGIVALIVILIAAGGFIYWQVSSVQQLKEQLAQDDKLNLKNGINRLQRIIYHLPNRAKSGCRMVTTFIRCQ